MIKKIFFNTQKNFFRQFKNTWLFLTFPKLLSVFHFSSCHECGSSWLKESGIPETLRAVTGAARGPPA